MQIIEVTTPTLENEFIWIRTIINRNLPNYVRPLDHEEKAILDPTKNPTFKHGTIRCWILRDDANQPIGRVAAFTNTKYVNLGTEFASGGVGYFDCINNQEAANILFDTAKKWLQTQGVEAMDGNINFGERDKNWGVLREGFDKEPVYGLAFNHPYYAALFENYGFKNYYNTYYFTINFTAPIAERFLERRKKFITKKEYRATRIQKNNLEKYAADFATIYNAAWGTHKENKSTTKEHTLQELQQLKSVLDENLIWFVYYNDQPIAMWINILDFNQYFKKFNGKFGWWQKMQLLWKVKTGSNKRIAGLMFGIIPKFQGMGIDGYLITEGSLHMKKFGNKYGEYEMGWTGDWNPLLLNTYKNLGTTQSRMLTVYRFIFDETKHPFERHPVLTK